MRGKIPIKKLGGRKSHIKIRFFVIVSMLLFSISMPRIPVQASSCPDLRVVFARGSGGERWKDKNYLEFKKTIQTKLETVKLKYEFIDLDYPAVGIGLDKIGVTLGAWVGAGEAYEFGDSVNTGVSNLTKLVNGASCPQTKYVIGGYSQGAMVVSKALKRLKSDRIIYAATFGDPKLYLPEGKGLMPAACSGKNLSDYRMYVPDCQAYKGLLGAYIPYEPENLVGKVGTWCNKRDIFCSSHFNMSDHLAYISENLYEDASRVIFDKITKAFGLKNHISSPHDTAILIDSTGSMSSMIDEYKTEALRLAKETFAAGGRVALYDYRDLNDPYTPVQHCNFETCTIENFSSELDAIQVNGGGDTPESLLSASFHVMNSLKWKRGSTKSLVVLTDANFLAPDRDGMTFDEVVKLSKKIDPVNFYIITNASYGDNYTELARQTDGKVVTNFDELNLLTDYIMERYDSLPRVEETASSTLPVLTINEKMLNSDSINVKFSNTGAQTVVALNDKILGIIDETEITVGGLNLSRENVLTLVPLNADSRGEAVTIEISKQRKNASADSDNFFVPKAPNTGKANLN
ncbi:cutinase family protein [Candidatus Saccharibacteria bacterium]|nr:cutinase family protein [Candidatus Saccharibacteria bacterium]